VTSAEIHKLQFAVQWAIIHPVESIDHGAATVDGSEGELAIAGPGAPVVAEFSVADLALALGMSSDAGRTYLGDAIELRHRLPKLWVVTVSGKVPVWKARKITQATKPLCPDAAYADRHLAHRAHGCSFAQIDRAVDDARRRYDPAEADKRRREAGADDLRPPLGGKCRRGREHPISDQRRAGQGVVQGPPCRGHHRYKTHAGWDVVRTGPTRFTWTNKHGCSYDWDTSHTQHTRHTR
jgi:hypothetical protein